MRRIALIVLVLTVLACDEPDAESAATAEEPVSTEGGADESSGDDMREDREKRSDDPDVGQDQQREETASHEPVDDISAVLEALCDDREPCEEMDRWQAGRVDATSLTVFELALHDRGEEGREPNLHDCAPFEYWLVESRDGAMTDHIRLQRVCNDGYGARGMGEDGVEVERNRFVHTQTGGSNWMWNTSNVVRLSPLRVLEEHRSGEWALDVNRKSESWDWTRPAGGVNWTAPHCDEREEDGGRHGYEPEHGEYRFDYLMQIQLDDPFRDRQWRTTNLEGCSLQVDSRGNDLDADDGEQFGSGYVTHGEPTDPGEASFRAVMGSESTLYLEIQDSEWITGADRWIHDDHVEIWTGPFIGYMTHCLEPDAPSQWGVSLFEDAVHSGYNDPDPDALSVQRHEVGDGDDPDAVRIKIEFETPPEALTVVYSDTDDGESQDRLIATSELRHGDAASLGQTREIAPDEARCRIVDGQLVFEDRREFEAATTYP